MNSTLEILVVDDNQELAENVCEILEELDGLGGRESKTSTAQSATEALARAEAGGIDLALIDVHLPDGDGVRLISELKARSPFVQVVVITGDASLESAIAAVDAGAFSYVLKPFAASHLRETATLALRQSALLKDRERLQRELEGSEKRHRGVVENVPALVLCLDEQGQITLWNSHIEGVTGFSREEMLGKPGADLIAGEGDRKLPLASGGHRLVRWRRAVVVEPGGARHTYALGLDVTEDREMMLRTLRSERLAAVGTLAAGLAHEVRNPLNSAMLQLQVLERRVAKQAPAEQLSKVVQIVRYEITRLENLVNDFLAFARPVPMEFQGVDLDELAESVLLLLGPEAAQVGVDLRLTTGASRADHVSGDPERLRQVLLNLIRNAVEAVGPGGNVMLSVQSDPKADDRVCLTVEDDGPGFEDTAPVFDAFYTTKGAGTGLGLSIVHRIVTEHGGEIAVESTTGCTRFTVSLPLAASN